MSLLQRLAVCVLVGVVVSLAAAWLLATLMRLDDHDVVALSAVRVASLRPSDAWKYFLHRSVGATREFAMVETDVPDSDLAAAPSALPLPTRFMAATLAKSRFAQPDVFHGGFICLDTRGFPLPALYSEWEYGDQGVAIAAGLPVRIPAVSGDAIFQPLDVIILPTRVHWLAFIIDVAVWTLVCWAAWEILRLTKRSSEPPTSEKIFT